MTKWLSEKWQMGRGGEVPVQRRTRIEEIIGKQLRDITWDDLNQLVKGRIPEAQDIEFKSQHYGSADKDKKDVATDIAAFANTTGGVLIIGIEEDDQGCASAISPVSLDEGQVRRYHQIVASQVQPLITFDSVNIEKPGSPSEGVVLLVIPRSGLAPHAAMVNESLRYPRRHGRSTNNLTEHEVAFAYRERAMRAQSRIELAEKRETEFLQNLDRRHPWLVMSLVPDFPGHVTFDQSAFEKYKNELVGKPAGVPWYSPTFSKVRIRHRRIYASNHDSPESGQQQWCAMELHTDGSGCYAARLATNRHEIPVPSTLSSIRIVSDETLADCILSGLEQLGKHSWSSAAQGMVNVRTQIWHVNDSNPIALGNDHDFLPSITDDFFTASHVCEVSIPIESVGRVGGELVAASAVLLQEASQSLGVVESRFLDVEGKVHLGSWSVAVRGAVKNWCVANGIELA